MKIFLSRIVQLEKYTVILDIGKRENRDEFIAYLHLAEENGGYLSAEAVSKNLLNNADITIGKRVVELCKSYYLINEQGFITDIGKQAIRNKSIYVPERGVYDIIVTQDFLYSEVLIDLRDSKSALLYEGIKDIKKEEADSKPEYKNLADSPNYVLNLKNKEILLPTTKQNIAIFAIGTKCIKQSIFKTEELFLELEIDIFAKPIVKFSKLFEDVRGLPEYINFNFHTIWKIILGRQSENWREVNGRYHLLSEFKDLKDAELKNWITTKTFMDSKIDNLGNFRTIRATDVPLFPKERQDAQEWAEYMLWDAIIDYLTDQDLQTKWNNIKDLFYPYELNNVTKLELIRKLTSKTKLKEEKFWYLHAPIDLSL